MWIQEKTGAVLEIPLHPALVEILAAHPADHMTFLITVAGKPFSAQGFTAWFRSMVREAGLPPGFSAHGLRKAMCRRLAESGCSASQIASISGHLSLREVSRYTAAADQKRMAADAMKAITKNSKVEHEVENRRSWVENGRPNLLKGNVTLTSRHGFEREPDARRTEKQRLERPL